MTYIPDFRNEVDKLEGNDRAYVEGFRYAMEQVKGFFDNLDLYNIEMYSEMCECSKASLEQTKESITDWMEREEINLVCSIFEDSKYDGIELKDGAEPLYNIRRASDD